MNYRSRINVVLLGVVVPVVSSVAIIDCGGDDVAPENAQTQTNDEAGTDGTTDGAPDGTAEASQPDAGGRDAAPDVSGDRTIGLDADDSGKVDSSVAPVDGEAGAVDSAVSATDTSVGPGVDASDAADAAVAVDAADANDAATAADAGDAADGARSLTGSSFPAALAQALCERIQACCLFGSAEFNTAKCVQENTAFGFRASSVGSELFDGGKIAFDPASAQSCLQDLSAIDCRTNQLTSARVKGIYQSCFPVYAGTVADGGACNGTIECAQGTFCEPGDAGTLAGFCTPERAAAQDCTDFGTNNLSASQSVCSYRGSGDTNLACQFADLTSGAVFAGNFFCANASADNAPCNTDLDCQSRLCDPNVFTCVEAEQYIGTKGCKAYHITDAGPGDSGGPG